jgi:hypothetical protein
MRRPPSYSDSYVFLPGSPSAPALAPLVIPATPAIVEVEVPAKRPWSHNVLLFTIKGSLHILFISAFETIFYFLYVSKSEDTGIVQTINTYYLPLVQSCDTWSNSTRSFLEEILRVDINQGQVDAAGNAARQGRLEYNQFLLNWSISYSAICLGIFLSMVGVVKWRQIPVPWGRLFGEHLMFVLVLALYEVFFFRTIIYNYDTITTQELNQYLVDGAFQCLGS